MTATTVKGVEITNITATTPTVNSSRTEGGRSLVTRRGAIEAATTSLDEAGDVMLLVEIPSNAVVLDIEILNDDLDAHATPTLTLDCGLYYSGRGGDQKKNGKTEGTVVDADCFTPTPSTKGQAANTQWAKLSQAPSDVKDIKKEAWDLGGLTSDPGGSLIVALTVETAAATAAAGGIVLLVHTLEA